jgi:hypothetical protein
VTEPKLLLKPYGWPNGTGISLRVAKTIDLSEASVMAGVALSFGCPAFVIPKIRDALYASGRYDCRVTVGRQALNNLVTVMREIDVEVVIEENTNLRPNGPQDMR